MSFRPDEQGFAALEADLAGLAVDVAEAIAQRARDHAPVRTGEYRDGIHVERDGDEVRVVADAPHSAVVEFGTGDTPAFAPLMRAQDDVAGALPQILEGRIG